MWKYRLNSRICVGDIGHSLQIASMLQPHHKFAQANFYVAVCGQHCTFQLLECTSG